MPQKKIYPLCDHEIYTKGKLVAIVGGPLESINLLVKTIEKDLSVPIDWLTMASKVEIKHLGDVWKHARIQAEMPRLCQQFGVHLIALEDFSKPDYQVLPDEACLT